jgi:hypothetical protein
MGELVADASGDLSGTTTNSSNGWGTVSKSIKTAGGYASTSTVLATFDGPDGATPTAGLLVDADGDLFGTTYAGGAFSGSTPFSAADGAGTVFEIKTSVSGYASTPITLASSMATTATAAAAMATVEPGSGEELRAAVVDTRGHPIAAIAAPTAASRRAGKVAEG